MLCIVLQDHYQPTTSTGMTLAAPVERCIPLDICHTRTLTRWSLQASMSTANATWNWTFWPAAPRYYISTYSCPSASVTTWPMLLHWSILVLHSSPFSWCRGQEDIFYILCNADQSYQSYDWSTTSCSIVKLAVTIILFQLISSNFDLISILIFLGISANNSFRSANRVFSN